MCIIPLDEIHDSQRFPSVQDFVSYCRLVKCAKESAGKRYGTAGTKIGNAYLKWAFSEAAVLFLRENPEGQKYLTKLEKKHGTGKALGSVANFDFRGKIRKPGISNSMTYRQNWLRVLGTAEPS